MSRRFVSTGAPATIAISQPAAWFVSLYLFVFALMAPVQHYNREIDGLLRDLAEENAAPLGSFRDPEAGGRVFFRDRYLEMPFQYGILHIIPALIWCITMPILLSDSFRAKRPGAHRFLGYVTAIVYVSLIISGVGFPLRHLLERKPLSFSHPNLLHLHKLQIKGYTMAVWPTFDVGLFLVFFMQSYSLYRTIRASRAHKYAEHRTWAIVTTLAGFQISTFRMGMILVQIVGFAYQLSPTWIKKELQIELKAGKEAWTAERAAFAWCTWFAFATFVIWMTYLLRTKKAVFNQKFATKTGVSAAEMLGKDDKAVAGEKPESRNEQVSS